MKTLKINNTPLSNYGIYISSDTYLDAPQIDYSEYQIPGRDGNVIQYNAINNVIRKFDCYIPEITNIDNAMLSLKKLLYANLGYLTLESDYDSGTYQEGYLAQQINVDPFNEKAAKFSLYFSCKPKKISKTLTTQTHVITTILDDVP